MRSTAFTPRCEKRHVVVFGGAAARRGSTCRSRADTRFPRSAWRKRGEEFSSRMMPRSRSPIISTLMSALMRPSVPSAAQRCGQVAAAVEAVGGGPFAEWLPRRRTRPGRHRRGAGGRGARAAISSRKPVEEPPSSAPTKRMPRHELGIVMPGDGHRAARGAGKAADDILHRHRAVRRARR